MLVKLTFMEFKLFVREFVVALFVLVLPVALLLAFGFQPGSRDADKHLGGQTGAEHIAAIGAGIALAILGLSVLPTTLAGYREKGVLRSPSASSPAAATPTSTSAGRPAPSTSPRSARESPWRSWD
jgi:ABC-2 type transport system permease protein